MQRNKGLDKVIDIWINDIYTKNNKLKLFIFGISKSNLERYNLKNLSNYNIYYNSREDMETMKTSGHIECSSINMTRKTRCCVLVFVYLQ